MSVCVAEELKKARGNTEDVGKLKYTIINFNYAADMSRHTI